jgi:hypothetical protein
MKRSEKLLLDNLRNKKAINTEEPLKNVKNSLGKIGQLVGNPLTKNEISINVDVFFCDNALHVIIAPAAIPVANQRPMPLYLFGLTDMYGNYVKSWPLTLSDPVWANPMQTGFVGYNLNAAPIDAILMLQLQNGDYVIFWQINVNTQALIRVRCENIAYSTLVHSLMSDIIYINTIRYNVLAAAILQYTHSLKLASLSTFGKLAVDSIDPRLFILPTSPQQNIADIPIKSPFDKTMIIATAIDFTCQHISFILFV